MAQDELALRLAELAAELIDETINHTPGTREGTVMTVGPPPYRRLDCDGRALAYIRTRPRKRAVRVDVSGLWVAPQANHLCVRNAGGATTLLVRSTEDLADAAGYLADTVANTRTALAEEKTKRRNSSS